MIDRNRREQYARAAHIAEQLHVFSSPDAFHRYQLARRETNLSNSAILASGLLTDHFRKVYLRRCIRLNETSDAHSEAEFLVHNLDRTKLLIHLAYGDEIKEEHRIQFNATFIAQHHAEKRIRKIMKICGFSTPDEIYSSSEFEQAWLIAKGLVKSKNTV